VHYKNTANSANNCQENIGLFGSNTKSHLTAGYISWNPMGYYEASEMFKFHEHGPVRMKRLVKGLEKRVYRYEKEWQG